MKPILIVDDEKNLRTVMRSILEQHGYTVLEAGDGNDAIRQFGAHDPMLVITDLLMPGKDGIETLFELKQIDAAVKVVALSGGGRICPGNYLDYARKLGAVATLRKPFTTEEFLAVVTRAISAA